jgi:uncharacterized membrane protein (DUF106 family)
MRNFAPFRKRSFHNSEEYMQHQKRPLFITILVSILFAGGLINILYAFTGAFASYGMFYPAGLVFLTILFMAALSGIWAMEKWGLWLFPFVLAGRLALDLATGAFHYAALLLLLFFFVFLYFRRRFV